MDPALADVVLRVVGLALVVVGAVLDLRSRRIPNALTLGGAVAGLAANVMVHQVPGAVTSVSGWVAGVALLAIPFALGGMGAGDVKLLALAGAWGGPDFALYTFLFGAIVGGVVAAGLLLAGVRASRRRAVDAADHALAATVCAPEAPRADACASGGTSREGESGAVSRLKIRFAYGPALALGGLVALLVR